MTCEIVQGLGAVGPAAVALACMVAAVHGVRLEGVARRRMLRLLEAERPGRRRCSGLRERFARWSGPSGPLRDLWPPAAAGLTVFVLVGGVAGGAAGLVAACGVRRWWRLRAAKSPGDAGDVDAVESGLPLAGDLLAACLAAGAGPRQAAAAVGSSLGGPVGDRLAQTAAELGLGAEPAPAWNRLGALPGAHGLARCLERAQATGVPAVEPVTRLAAECRAEAARRATARARHAGVMATAPLGLCFLPAFLMLGVAPVLIGLATRLLSGG